MKMINFGWTSLTLYAQLSSTEYITEANLNRHVGQKGDGVGDYHGNHELGIRNEEGETLNLQ